MSPDARSGQPGRALQADTRAAVARRVPQYVLAVVAVSALLAPCWLVADAVPGRRARVAGLHEECADRAVGGAAGDAGDVH